MSQSFIVSAVVFLIVMVTFHLIKDIIIRGHNITPDMRSKINNRWLISTAIGLILLFFFYGCVTEVDICNKGEPSNGVICIEIYQPVRAPDGTIYSNSCLAEADGWENGCLELEPVYSKYDSKQILITSG